MKIYVAGILFEKNHCAEYGGTKIIIEMINILRKDANIAMGEDAILVIVLPEYALTPTTIRNNIKKEYLKALEEEIKKYKNVLLIPGSFSTYFEDYPEEKKNKLINNYTNNLIELISADKSSVNEEIYFDYLAYYPFYKDDILSKVNNMCLQNSTYIINSEVNNKRLKHHKSCPIDEESRLLFSKNNFFRLGEINEVKSIVINNQSHDVGLSICLEHRQSPNNNILQNPPLFHIIVSASINTIQNYLYGAISIHMDKRYLQVYRNQSHPKQSIITQIQAYCYYPSSNNKIEVPITIFNKELNPNLIFNEAFGKNWIKEKLNKIGVKNIIIELYHKNKTIIGLLKLSNDLKLDDFIQEIKACALEFAIDKTNKLNQDTEELEHLINFIELLEIQDKAKEQSNLKQLISALLINAVNNDQSSIDHILIKLHSSNLLVFEFISEEAKIIKECMLKNIKQLNLFIQKPIPVNICSNLEIIETYIRQLINTYLAAASLVSIPQEEINIYLVQIMIKLILKKSMKFKFQEVDFDLFNRIVTFSPFKDLDLAVKNKIEYLSKLSMINKLISDISLEVFKKSLNQYIQNTQLSLGPSSIFFDKKNSKNKLLTPNKNIKGQKIVKIEKKI